MGSTSRSTGERTRTDGRSRAKREDARGAVRARLRSSGELYRMAWRDLWSHPLRATLSVVSVASALAITVVLLAGGNGLHRAVGGILRELGEGQIEVDPGRTTGPGGQRRGGRRVRILYDDIRAVASQLPSFEAIAPYAGLYGGGASSYRYSIPWSPVRAVSQDYLRARGVPVVEGRWFTRDEDEKGEWVAVLNEGLRRMIFRDEEAVGKWVEWRGRRMTVVGVVRDEALFPYILLVPYNTARQISDTRYISGLVARPVRGVSWEKATGEIRRVLAGLGGFDPRDTNALEIEDNREFTQSVQAGTTSLHVLVLTIAGVSLLLGGLGVANIMVISVTERTRAIGLRKAVGAPPRAIFLQVLFEALTVVSIGGVLGIAGGFAACSTAGSIPMAEGYAAELRLEAGAIAVSLVALALVGLLSGWIPARRAASLPAAEALRWE